MHRTLETIMPYAAIFDVDGVLVDSYDAHLRSWRDLGRETGVAFSQEQFATTFGQTSRDIIRRYWPIAAHDDDAVARLDHRKEQMFRQIVSREFPIMDGAPELIASLHEAGVAIALGSSGPPENVELAIQRLGVRGQIGAAVTGKDVTRGKPDPEVFLVAAERLQVEPARCAVIEDAPAGILAAHAAGMSAIALISRGRDRKDFANHPADEFADGLREITPQRLMRLIDAHTAHGGSR